MEGRGCQGFVESIREARDGKDFQGHRDQVKEMVVGVGVVVAT